METIIHVGSQRPATVRAIGSRGTDMSSLFDGSTKWESDDQRFAKVATDLQTIANKIVADGETGSTTVRARGTLDGVEYVAEIVVTAQAVELPPETVSTFEIVVGDEEPIA